MAKHCKKGKTLTVVGESNPVEYKNKAGEIVKDIEIRPIKIIFGSDARSNAYDGQEQKAEQKVAHATPPPAAPPVAADPTPPSAPPPGFAWSYMNNMFVLIPLQAPPPPNVAVMEQGVVVIDGV